MKYKGNYVAAPVNVHRVNWMWANPAVLKKAGVKLPKDLGRVLRRRRKGQEGRLDPGRARWPELAGLHHLRVGGAGRRWCQVLQEGAGQARPEALTSPTMKKSLDDLPQVKGYTDKDANGRDWNLATAMVIKGKAGFQFMGDWAKGEFIAAGKVPGKDFVCVAAPGTAKAYTFNVDSFAMFKLKNEANAKGPGRPGRRHHGHRVPGSVQPEQGLDPGAPEHEDGQVRRLRQAVGKDFVDDAKSGGLVPSIAHGMAMPPAAEGAIKDVVSQFWNDDKMSRRATRWPRRCRRRARPKYEVPRPHAARRARGACRWRRPAELTVELVIAQLCAGAAVHLRLHDLERRAVADRLAHAAQLRVRRACSSTSTCGRWTAGTWR